MDTSKAANELISERKASTEGGDLKKEQQEFVRLTATKQRYEPKAEVACQSYQDPVKDKKGLEEDKEAAKQKLDEHTETVMALYQTRINELLERFGAGFRIINTGRSYQGSRPSTSYQLVINDIAVDLGDATTPVNRACFKNTLSAGDRSTLALSFFIAQVERDVNLATKVIILDDPFSSQDASRRQCTQQLICRLCDSAKQVVVLSHESRFLRLVWDEVKKADVKTLQMMRLGKRNTTVGEWDIEADVQEDYFKNHGRLTAYFNESVGEARLAAHTLRLLLEGYLRFKLPGQFENNDWLGDMIKKIRESDATSPASRAKPILGEVNDINEYSKKYHHDQNQGGADTEPIDDGELQTYVGRTLDVVGGF